MAMIMARDKFDRRIQDEGNPKSLVVYTSAESHYSISKNASFMGLGRNGVRFIACDSAGRMIPDELEKQIKKDRSEGYLPFFVNATAGTTVLGVFDPIDVIYGVTNKYGLWLHVDGAFGGSLIFSSSHKYLLKGIEKADSFTLNAHKMLGTPLTCTIILARNKDAFHHSFSNDASYLFQTDTDEFNLGKISMQCGRRNDALKFWTLWKYEGTAGLRNRIEKQLHLARFAREYISLHPDYSIHNIPDALTVCFNYKDIPASVLCQALYEKGKVMIGYGSFEGVEFVRLVTVNHENTEENMRRFFTTLEQFAEKHYESLTAGLSFHHSKFIA
jgi:sulfinoalanine decarboxylase/sulfinoalanine decarboxylase/aspartate 1-decarboxylase